MHSVKLGLVAAAALLLGSTALTTPAFATGNNQNHTCQGGHNCNTGGGGDVDVDNTNKNTAIGVGVGYGGQGGDGGAGGNGYGGDGGNAYNVNANVAKGGDATNTNNIDNKDFNANINANKNYNHNDIDNTNKNYNTDLNFNKNDVDINNKNIQGQAQSLENKNYNQDINNNKNIQGQAQSLENKNYNQDYNVNKQGQAQGQKQHQDQDQDQHQGQLQGQAQNVEDSGNSSVHIENERPPVNTAYSAALATSEDTCMGSSSIGGQAVSFGLTIGTTWTDDNCQRLKNSRQLVALGYHRAATALMCFNEDVAAAMDRAGTPCPSGAAVYVAPPPPEREYVPMEPIPDRPVKRKRKKPLPPK